jgi:GxxExxY protein
MIKLDCGYRVCILIEDKLIIELKSVEIVLSIHESQLLINMKLSSIKTGLLINFDVRRLEEGLKRYVL